MSMEKMRWKMLEIPVVTRVFKTQAVNFYAVLNVPKQKCSKPLWFKGFHGFLGARVHGWIYKQDLYGRSIAKREKAPMRPCKA